MSWVLSAPYTCKARSSVYGVLTPEESPRSSLLTALLSLFPSDWSPSVSIMARPFSFDTGVISSDVALDIRRVIIQQRARVHSTGG